MPLRFLGFAMVLVASTAAGNLVAGSYRARLAELGQLRVGLHLLGTEIAYAMSALPDALSRVAQGVRGPIRRLFLKTADLLDSGEGISAGEAWERAIAAAFPATALDAGDMDVIRALSGYLGLTDRQDQERHLRLAEERLRAREAEAAAERASSERMWRYLGALGGLALGVALL